MDIEPAAFRGEYKLGNNPYRLTACLNILIMCCSVHNSGKSGDSETSAQISS